MYSSKINGMYYCFLGRVLSGEPELGNDPEIIDAEQELKEVRWFYIDDVKEHIEIRRILPKLQDILIDYGKSDL